MSELVSEGLAFNVDRTPLFFSHMTMASPWYTTDFPRSLGIR